MSVGQRFSAMLLASAVAFASPFGGTCQVRPRHKMYQQSPQDSGGAFGSAWSARRREAKIIATIRAIGNREFAACR
jgi:hypothetical protein